MIWKLTAPLEYFDLMQNFHARIYCIILAYEIHFTTKIKQIMIEWITGSPMQRYTCNYAQWTLCNFKPMPPIWYAP